MPEVNQIYGIEIKAAIWEGIILKYNNYDKLLRIRSS